ncbi:chaperonin 10-like protein [Morchella snyderi]|nr:chaperonin 10-like protein [Morchella snyderi]
MSAQDYKFKGWVGLDKDCVEKGTLVEQEFTPKPFGDSDVDIKITHCGVCGSDVHTLSSGWGATPYPICVGHEIVGHAVRVGKDVKEIKVGDRVGVGAQSCSCMKPDCSQCHNKNEQYCDKHVGTYGGFYPDGSKSMGGYGDYARVHEHFVFKIPDTIPSEIAAPMFCAGVTMYSPLKRNGAGPGKTVGIIGIGGLGHYGILWAKALGADKVIAISRYSNKSDDAKKLGATSTIATTEDSEWAQKNAESIDLIISTIYAPNMPISDYLTLLKPHGTYIQVGAPEDKVPGFSMFPMIMKGVKLGGSLIGSPTEIKEMLQLAADKGIKGWINEWPMSKVNEALAAFHRGEPRYRIVLVNEKHAN